jgi:ABC-2 type transport system permease protein
VSDLGLALRQVRFTNKAFWRNPASAFFTFAFPLMFLVIFTSLLGNGTTTFKVPPYTPAYTVHMKNSTYYVVAMAAFGVITATYTNIAMSVTFQRDAGILKRVRGTPLPAWGYLFGRVVHAVIVAAILVAVTMAFGKISYGAQLPTGKALLQFLVAFLVGALSFTALALAITAVIPNADAAPPIVNATVLPLLFLSGIFIPLTPSAPAWIRAIANFFPVKHFFDAIQGGFLSGIPNAGNVFPFKWTDILVIAIWGVVGLVLAIRFFSWEPRK